METVPGSEVNFSRNGGPDKRCYRVDFGKISRVLTGFQPKWNARRGAKQLYESYRKIGLHVEDFEGARYNRIDQIKELISTNQLDPSLFWKEKRFVQN